MQKLDRRMLRDPEEIKRRITGDIQKLNVRLLKVANRLTRTSRNHIFGRTPPGGILTSLYRKAVYTTRGMEKLKQSRLIEEAWILLRVLLETHINFFYFVRNDPRDMCRRYAAAAVLDKLKYLREVNFFEGAPTLAAQNPRDKWEEMESEIRSHYTAAELKSMRRYGFSGKSVEARAEAIGLKSLYDNCYRIASRNVHMFDPAETVVTRGIFRGRAHSRRELLRLRREQLESTQNLLLGRLSFGMSEVMKDHLASAELILIGLGYEKFRDRSSSPAR